jgi:hypothetical protein
MALESLDGAFGIVLSMYVKWGKFDPAMSGNLKFSRCFVVKEIPIDNNDLGIFPSLVDGLVCFYEVMVMQFHAFGIDVISIKFNCHHDVFVAAPR